MSIPHDELSRHGERWLRELQGCWPTKIEATNNLTRERCDVIGWTRPAFCFVIEVKTSLEDLRRDADKPHRYHGMGNVRYMLAERYVFEPFQMPEGWGLLEYDPESGQVLITKDAPKLYASSLVNYAAQQSTLIQIIRDAGKGGGDAEAGRRSNNGHIPQSHHDEIAEYVRAFEGCRAKEVVSELRIQPKQRTGTVAKHLAEDARNGLIKGVRAEGSPALLYPTEGR